MQKENLMETVVSAASPAPVETPVPGTGVKLKKVSYPSEMW